MTWDDKTFFSQKNGVIQQQRLCSNRHQVTLTPISDNGRCFAWVFQQELGLRKGTWLPRSRIELLTVIPFIYCWSNNLATIKLCSKELSIGQTTTKDWKNGLRKNCVWWPYQIPKIVRGPGLHARSIKRKKPKAYTGRVLPQQWIFSGICSENKSVHTRVFSCQLLYYII